MNVVVSRHFYTYLFIGGIALLIELSVFIVLAQLLGFNLIISNATAMAAGMVTSFGLNYRYNFNVSDRFVLRFAGFAAVTLLSYLVSTTLIALLLNLPFMSLVIAKVITIPIVLLVQFTLNKRFTFASQAQDSQSHPRPDG